MNKITKAEIIEDAKSLKITISDDEAKFFCDEVNEYMETRPDIDYSNIEALRYVNPETINVFSSGEQKLIDVDDLISNVKDREGNYVKVPRVIK